MGYEPIALTAAPRCFRSNILKSFSRILKYKCFKMLNKSKSMKFSSSHNSQTLALLFIASARLHEIFFTLMGRKKERKKKRAVRGIEPLTSCTQNRNHTTRPNGQRNSCIIWTSWLFSANTQSRLERGERSSPGCIREPAVRNFRRRHRQHRFHREPFLASWTR